MNVGFFGDDTSACHAALLANNAFNRRSTVQPQILAGGHGIAGAMPAYLDAAAERGTHLMVALPLAELQDAAIRRRLDIAVVTAGPNVIARAAARQAMARDALQRPGDVPPAWLLDGHGLADAPMPRTLPFRMIPLKRREAWDLRSGCDSGPLNWRAIGLAAALRIVADEPFASEIAPADVVRMLAGGFPDPDASLREDLLDLAADLDDGIVEAAGAMGRRAGEPSRRVVSRRRRPTARMVPNRPARAQVDGHHAAGRASAAAK